MSGTSKPFVVKHEFVDMTNMQYGKMYLGDKTRRFDRSWRVCVYRDKGKLVYGLECLKNHDDSSVEASFQSKLITKKGTISEKDRHWFKFDNYSSATKWTSMRKRILEDGKLTVEFHVQVENIVRNPGTNKNDPSRSKTSEDFTLIVEQQDIVVKKQLLVTQSKYFKSLFSRSPMLKSMGLHDVRIDDICDLLDVLEEQLIIDDEIVSGVLTAAFKFQFEKAVNQCEAFLMETSAKSRTEKLGIAHKFKLQKLKKHLNKIDDSERCVVSTDSLRCGICYEIFDGSPQTLQCGHTFCSTCIKGLTANRPNINMQCPICRNISKSSPNYTLIGILESMAELSEKEEKKAYSSTMNANNSRLRKRCEEAEKQINLMSTERNILADNMLNENNRLLRQLSHSNRGYNELYLTQWKINALHEDDNHFLLHILHHAKVVKNIKESCKTERRALVKRQREPGNSDSSFDNSFGKTDSSKKTFVDDDDEPRTKKVKNNFTGPFSSEDFMTHMYPTKSGDVPKSKDPAILYKDRLVTFKNFRFDKIKNAKCTSESLALAGFVSTGSTSAMCPFCSKSKDFKPTDEPMKEHQKMGTRCVFLKLSKSNIKASPSNFELTQEAIAMASATLYK
ncbi:hypothetical protein CAEBREN_03572 [Caenorhabditis brenneri]|uniref:RING-type domain-containing protein n=1 Tax=Caenorhabditis brenneri TaxID=135651 RepID=G0N757_CAEBE|nr:hypothetical protein CAEBREN_03572 [Caenorhabditis brenneri]